jgi:hypothetical protein
LLRALPRSFQVTPDIPAGDERDNKIKSDRAPVDSLKESQLAAGRDHLLRVGRHRRAQSEQQASLRTSYGSVARRSRGLRHPRGPDLTASLSGVSIGLISRFVERVPSGVGEAREGEREQASNAVVARDRRVAQPLDEGACDAGSHGRDEVQPV